MGNFQVTLFIFWWFFSTSVSNAEAPRFFIFGDSLVDVGNNNYIVTIAKADSRPNGIDFIPTDGHPTGRFCNGKTVVDIIGDEFRSSCYPPPYLAPNSNEYARTCGVNYASGGAGILNKTGYIFIGRISMDAQVDNFANTRRHLILILGKDKAMELIGRSVYTIVMGSNDFLSNYYLPVLSEGTRKLVPPEVFIELMITTFRVQLQTLIRLGARKIALANVGPIGCIPAEREANPLAGKDCVAKINNIAMSFNTKLRVLVNELNSEFPEATLVYMNIYKVVSDLLHTSTRYGFEVNDSGCCRTVGRFGGIIPCASTSTYCSNRAKYFFWDPFHPSEEVNKLIAKRLLDGDVQHAYPMNLRKLVEL